jgi:hypothetical protein
MPEPPFRGFWRFNAIQRSSTFFNGWMAGNAIRFNTGSTRFNAGSTVPSQFHTSSTPVPRLKTQFHT